MPSARETIITENTLREHFNQYQNFKVEYVNAIISIFPNVSLMKSITNVNKARIVTTLLQHKDRITLRQLYKYIDLPEMVKACEVLDANRWIRQMEKKVVNKGRKGYHLKNKINLVKESLEGLYELSLTSSKTKLVKEWIHQLSKNDIEYRALMFPNTLWKQLADLNHFHPERDFENVPWFLRYCFGKDAPVDSVVGKVQNLSFDNFAEIYRETPLPLEFLRLKLNLSADNNYNPMVTRAKEMIATRENLSTVLWYYKELETKEVNNMLASRLSETSSNDVSLSYGMLVDLLIHVRDQNIYKHLVRIAEDKLKTYESSLASPVAVFGDASNSMQTAINTSSIITSLLCSLTHASLTLFRSKDYPVTNPPTTVQSAIKFAKTMTANDCTAPAASLWPYYNQKKEVKTFILVTDEVENATHTGSCRYGNGYTFADLYKKYHDEVYPAKLVFISFSNPNTDAYMIKNLKQVMGIDFVNEKVDIFKFDVNNPDLNKLDMILQKLSLHKEVLETEPVVEKNEDELLRESSGFHVVSDQIPTPKSSGGFLSSFFNIN